jgi:peptide/nickel transport system permease protein
MLAGLVAGRVLTSLLTLVLVSVFVFAAVEAIPGDAATRLAGRESTPEQVETLRRQMGLDVPLPGRYLRWFGSVVGGDLGSSLTSRRPVRDVLGPRLANTAWMGALAFLLYVPLCLGIAIVQAVRRHRPIDHALSVITLVLLSMPDFLIATILLLVFAVGLGWLPAMSVISASTPFTAKLAACVLPAVALALIMGVYAVRMLRDNLIEILDADFVRMAELKGLGPARVIWRHALPNALVPTLNITALNLAYLIGGVVVVERVFSFPGFGSLMVDALKLLDEPVIAATVLIAAAIYIAANLLADVAAILLNPRLRTA